MKDDMGNAGLVIETLGSKTFEYSVVYFKTLLAEIEAVRLVKVIDVIVVGWEPTNLLLSSKVIAYVDVAPKVIIDDTG